jgi:hypothetical protein
LIVLNALKGAISLQFQIVLSVMRQFLDDVKPFSLILFYCKIRQQWDRTERYCNCSWGIYVYTVFCEDSLVQIKCQRKPKGQTAMDSQVILATLGTQDTDEDKQNTKTQHNTEN